ncbi:uncharacterized protein TM35_000122520 [Trypanosoma theileri]|uniref:Uncharacterized protein n=1 Tax=Trypanosoma theileri TaxID=67003 RepID=A0A1X0NXQ9_9TRYP|nr:uncharacterized protein TM35_000122520 [Trypanosoma theileri]ORC89477.1 hypothetical protein TM35_000122520 [Trypanosoma theileri]
MPKVEKKNPLLTQLFTTMEKKYPHRKSQIQLASRLTEKGVDLLDTVYPIGERVYNKIAIASSTIKENQFARVLPILLGFALCFFGGCFTILVTLLEVLYLTSWDRIKKNVNILYDNYRAVREASAKDDTVDANNNGIPDVQELTRNELFSRKLRVFLNSVDITAVNDAMNALVLAFLAITAALHDKISCALAFGCSTANIVKKYCGLKKFLEDNLPPEQKKLAEPISNTILNGFCMILTVIFEKYAITAYCAARGAQLIIENASALQKELASADGKEKNIGISLDTPKGKAIIILLTVMGFVWQAYNGFTLPFPINILLFPITLVDGLLGVIFRVSVVLLK